MASTPSPTGYVKEAITVKKHDEYTESDLLQQERVNFSSHMAFTYSFLQEKGIAIGEYIRYLGLKFAPGWKAEVTSLDDFQEGILINVLANGGTLISVIKRNAHSRKLEVSEVLSKEIFQECSVSPELTAVLWDKLTIIAEGIGYHFDWKINNHGNYEIIISDRE
jgi:hypothetical protein